ncbi:MAG: ribosome maturation factor RimM [Burkholderiales bacterium]
MPEQAADSMVVMGRVAAPFAVAGWIKIRPYTQAPDTLLQHPVWWLGEEGAWQQREVVESAIHGAYIVARVRGCDDRDSAQRLAGSKVALPRTALPAPGDDEYYWADLLGLKVVSTQAQVLGEVKEVFDTGSNDVLRVVGERERLIPFTKQVIVDVDMDARLLRVEWDADF